MLRFFQASFLLFALLFFLSPAPASAQAELGGGNPDWELVLPTPGPNPSPPELDSLPTPVDPPSWPELGEKDKEDKASDPPNVEVVSPEPEPLIAPPPPPVLINPNQAVSSTQMAKPAVEVWHPDSRTPQMPQWELNKLTPSYLTGTDSVWVRVQFTKADAGKWVFVKPGPGITLDPPDPKVTVPESGECLFAAQIAEGVERSHVIFYCQGVKTVMPVVRAPVEAVRNMEALTEGVYEP